MLRKYWPLCVVLVVQAAILILIPMRKVIARIAGTEITLQTRPVDPYDVLSGYYVTLAYEVEVPEPGLVESGMEEGQEVWIAVERAEPAWRSVGLTREKPEADPDHVGLKAVWRSSWRGQAILDGVHRFYIPEAEREKVADLMRKAEGRAFVDMRVDGNGNMALMRLRVMDQTFGSQKEPQPHIIVP
jgi:uncharacterized membrane-anchored protein